MDRPSAAWTSGFAAESFSAGNAEPTAEDTTAPYTAPWDTTTATNTTHTITANPRAHAISKHLHDKHFLRKHGGAAYYGQKKPK